MRSFYLVAATLLFSPLAFARTITVDEDKLEALEKAMDELKSSVETTDNSRRGSRGSSSGVRNVIVDTVEEPVGSSVGSVVVDTEDDLEEVSQNYRTIDAGPCTGTQPQCLDERGPFNGFVRCWQFCVAAKSTKNPRSNDCANLCRNTCGCPIDESLKELQDAENSFASAQPSPTTFSTSTRTSSSTTTSSTSTTSLVRAGSAITPPPSVVVDTI